MFGPKKAILVEKNTEVESLYSLNLRTYVDIEIIPKKKGEYAIKQLEKDNEIDLIITRANIDQEETDKIILDYLKNKELNIPVIILGATNYKDKENVYNLATGVDLKGVVALSAKCLNITAEKMSKMSVPNFFPIPVNYFSVIKKAICPIYAQEIETEEYTLKLDKDQTIDPELVKQYISEGIPELFVKREDRLRFVNSVTSEMISLISQNDLAKEDATKANEISNKLLGEKLAEIGLTTETIGLAKKNMKNVQGQVLSSGNKLGKLLKNLLSNRASYRFTHTQITTFICHHLMKRIDWGTPEQEEKLAFVAFFNDITLLEDRYVRIRSKRELKAANLTQKEEKIVNEHAMRAAELIQKYPKAPMGADSIIRQHHGVLNGVGFSEHYGANLSPTTIVFIIAEEYAKILLDSEKKLSSNQVVEKLRETFTTARFRKILEALEEVEI